ncbi:MAG: hypothetical protein QXM68_02150 [Candidatus Aenigmatarchaeota archaeon]|nr:hypothetical protein [Candidatus Aenigmarchaeota archaeon]
MNEEKELTKIKVFRENPFLVKENLIASFESFFKFLDETENMVLKTLLIHESALSIYKIKRMISRIIIMNFFEKKDLLTMRLPTSFDSLTINYTEDSNIRIVFDDFSSEKNLEKSLKEITKKYGIKFPSYFKIKQVLENFENMGIVFKRQGLSKAQTLYYINPDFFKLYKLTQQTA